MMYALIGAFALIASTVASYGLAVILHLGKVILTFYATFEIVVKLFLGKKSMLYFHFRKKLFGVMVAVLYCIFWA